MYSTYNIERVCPVSANIFNLQFPSFGGVAVGRGGSSSDNGVGLCLQNEYIQDTSPSPLERKWRMG